MRCHEEYKAITDAGLIVQVDEPEFCTTWSFYPDWSVDDLRKYLDGRGGDHQPRAARHARGAGPLPHLLGQRPPPARRRTSSSSTSPTSW